MPVTAKVSLPFLRRACLDILQRTPSPAERRNYLGAPVPIQLQVPRLVTDLVLQ